jgi:ferrous iron transport protein B
VVGIGSARVAVARSVLTRMGLRDGAGALNDALGTVDAPGVNGTATAAGAVNGTATTNAAASANGSATDATGAVNGTRDDRQRAAVATLAPTTGGGGCHGESGDPDTPEGAPTVALVGSPNVGKSTLFNAITGARRRVGNWPGTTVEVGRGRWTIAQGQTVALMDLPGTYSLDPVSPDEQLTRTLLLEVPPADRPDLVVVTVNASDVARGLYLVSQVREQPLRVVVALTMLDVAARRGSCVDPQALAKALGVPVVCVDPRRRSGVAALAPVIAKALAADVPQPIHHAVDGGGGGGGGGGGPLDELDDLELDLDDARFAWIAAAVGAATMQTDSDRVSWSDRADRIVTSSVGGPLVFLGVMWAMFQLTTTGAAPLVNALDRLVSGPVTTGAVRLLGALGLGGSWVEGLIVNGLIAGVGMVLTFVPLMTLMFVLLALLEDSGYLARAAVVSDRLMRSIGLPGRAVVPLVMGFGCNVPAVSATRILPDARHRLLTALLVPFTSCSARLPVYVMVAAALFGRDSGNVVFGMYLASIVLVILVGLLLRGTVLRGTVHEPLVLDLPSYQVPVPRVLAVMTWSRLSAFLRSATGIIVVTIVAIWLLSAIPTQSGKGGFGEVPIEHSAFAAVATTIAPVFEPAGFGNWHTAGALVAGFVAKEAVVSSWAQTYAAEEPGNLHRPGRLGSAVRADFTSSSHGHPKLAGMAFLLFLLAYAPCVATVTAQVREIGRRWTMIGMGLGFTMAWTIAVAVFQIGRVLG